jgi:hypothetical protein
MSSRARSFYWVWFKTAFKHSWSVFDSVATGVAVLSAIVIHFLPKSEQFMTALVWQVPLSMCGFFVVARIVLAPYWMYQDKQKRKHQGFQNISSHYQQMMAAQDEEIKEYKNQLEEKKKVHLDVAISEVFIIPEPGIAECFVKASIHNSTPERPITIPEYKVCLTIAGKKYCHNRAESEISGFQRAYFVEETPDYREPYLAVAKTKPLVNLKEQISDAYPLKTGFPKTGWLHFTIVGVPTWPKHREFIGKHMELDSTGEEVEVDDTIDTLLTTNVESVELSVRDPFYDWHSQAKAKPLHSWERGVVRANDHS